MCEFAPSATGVQRSRADRRAGRADRRRGLQAPPFRDRAAVGVRVKVPLLFPTLTDFAFVKGHFV